MSKSYPGLTPISERAYANWQQEGCPENQAAKLAAMDCRIDVEEKDSFPASDPPSHSVITGIK